MLTLLNIYYLFKIRERRVFCVLLGTILLEYNSEEESHLGASAARAMVREREREKLCGWN
jgi:hypothetical protein